MRFIIGVLIAIGLVVLIIVLILSGGGPSPQKPSLISYANTSTVVRMTIDGAVVADQNHREIEVTVGQNSSSLQIIAGYQDHVIKTKSYSNNESSYNVFLHALQLAGYTNGDDSASLKDDLGVCPLGDRFIFTIQNGSDQIQRYWTTNCNGGGSFKGNTDLVITLFQRQIPDYSSLTENVAL